MTTTNYSGLGGGQYEAARRGVENQYTQNSTQNAYGRFLSQQRGQRSLGDMQQGFQRSYPGYTAQFGQRGLSGGGVNSGAMQQSMGNYIGDYYRDYGRAQQDLTQELQQFDLGQSQLDAWRQNELMNIEQQKANDIANTANILQMLQQYLGGT